MSEAAADVNRGSAKVSIGSMTRAASKSLRVAMVRESLRDARVAHSCEFSDEDKGAGKSEGEGAREGGGEDEGGCDSEQPPIVASEDHVVVGLSCSF